MTRKAGRLALLTALCLSLSARCGADQPEDVEGLIQRGGAFWSSPVKVSRGDTSFTPGNRFWVWPAEDRVFEGKDGKLTVRFHWRLRPGQRTPQEKDDVVFAHIDLLSEGSGSTFFNFQAHRLELAAGQIRGEFEITFDMKDLSGKGEIVFFLSGARLFPQKTDSNLLRLIAKLPKEH